MLGDVVDGYLIYLIYRSASKTVTWICSRNSLENKFTTDCIYLDYQKAFDSVPHKRLISKLRSYRFNPLAGTRQALL